MRCDDNIKKVVIIKHRDKNVVKWLIKYHKAIRIKAVKVSEIFGREQHAGVKASKGDAIRIKKLWLACKKDSKSLHYHK